MMVLKRLWPLVARHKALMRRSIDSRIGFVRAKFTLRAIGRMGHILRQLAEMMRGGEKRGGIGAIGFIAALNRHGQHIGQHLAEKTALAAAAAQYMQRVGLMSQPVGQWNVHEW